ncbi:MAG TPA: Ig-like domain repeat protein, partial [Vicinamibacterales bacterium]|nr:Ig-like domain repeat protein [Vicinamibacterales bacterium]
MASRFTSRIPRARGAAFAAFVLIAVLAALWRAAAFSEVGTISTIAGTGVAGFGGDGGPATAAQLNRPNMLALDSAGNPYFSDYSNLRVRKVDRATGIVTTVAGNGTAGFSGDGGPATSASMRNPIGIAIDAQGNIYIADWPNNRVRKVTAATGTITTVAGDGTTGGGGDGGLATSASLTPIGLAVDPGGHLYIADSAHDRVRRVDAATGIITTVAGTGAGGFSGDGGLATNAQIEAPRDIAIDAAGNLYIADTGNQRVRRVDAATGIITTLAGTGTAASTGSGGLAVNASLNQPYGLTVDSAGNVYLTERNAAVVRKIDAATGFIVAMAGTGAAGFNGDGPTATAAMLNSPTGVVVTPTGDLLYIGDFENHRVRAVVLPAEENSAPAVALSGATVVIEGSTATYTFTVTDENAGDTFTVTAANCGTGGTVQGTETTTASGGSFVCAFGNGPASSTVSVQVADGAGASDTATLAVTVNNAAPVIQGVSASGPVQVGQAVAIAVTASDPGGDALVYSFDCANDGTFEIGPQAGATALCTYAAAGEYTVAVRVTDSDGASSTLAAPIVQVTPFSTTPMVAAGRNFTAALRSDGTVVAAGLNSVDAMNVRGWTDVVYVALGTESEHVAGVRRDGTVLAAGTNADGQLNVGQWSNIIQAAVAVRAGSTGGGHTVGLRADGTVLAAGSNASGQLNVGAWTNIVQVAAHSGCTIGVRADGKVLAAGCGTEAPTTAGWTNVVQVDTGGSSGCGTSACNIVALRSDGSVVGLGRNLEGQLNFSGWADIVQVAAGDLHTVGLRADGTVLAIGRSSDGQLNVETWTNVVRIAAGFRYTLGLRSDGTILSTGLNQNDQLNVGLWKLYDPKPALLPAVVAPTPGQPQIAAGSAHTVALRSDGTVIGAGSNSAGQLNVSGWTDIVRIASSANATFTVGLKSDGTVVATGDNASGQLNVGAWTGIAGIAAGNAHTVGLRSDGTVVAVGNSGSGRLSVTGWTDIVQVAAGDAFTVGLRRDGTVAIAGSLSSPSVTGWVGITAIAAGAGNAVGIKADGTVVGAGTNSNGQLNFTSWTNVVQVAVGGNHTAGLRSDGTVVAVGHSSSGQLTVGSWTNVVQVAAGNAHTLGLRADGTVLATGHNGSDQLNVGLWKLYDPKPALLPAVVAPTPGQPQIAAGRIHTVALRSDGTVIGAGSNSAGQLNVSGWTDIVRIASSANADFTVGLKSDGTVVATGDNASGQLNVGAWTGIAGIAAGNAHTVGLRSDGTVVAVGSSGSGRLNVTGWTDIVQVAAGDALTVGLRRDGTVAIAGSLSFSSVTGWVGITAIAAGAGHAVGIKAGGTVVGAGTNLNGQLNFTSWTNVVQVAGGGNHTAGLRSDGTVVAVGHSSSGQLTVGSWTNVVQVAAGNAHTVGLRADGTVLATGNSSSGQTNVSGWNLIVAPNSPPTVSLTGASSVNEGSSSTYSFTVTDPDAGDTFTVTGASCGANGTLQGSVTTTASGGSFVCRFPNGPAASTVSVQVADAGGAASNTATLGVTVNNVAPAISLVTVSGPVFPGEPVTIAVTASDPGGDALAYSFDCANDGTFEIGPQAASTATCTYASPGSYTPRVRVTDADDASTTTVAPAATVANPTPVIALTASPNGSTYGGSVTFTATVTASGSAPQAPTGTVQFRDGAAAMGAPVTLAGGSASLTLATLSGGSHAITAVYSGDSVFTAITSSVLTHVVAKATATVVAMGGAFTYDGQAHGGTCSVTGVGSDVLTGTTTYNTGGAPVDAGTHTITCSFAGDGNYEPASDTAEIVIGKATASAVATGGSFTYDGQPHGGTCSVTGVGGSVLPATTTYSTGGVPVNAGTHTITCSFAGDGNYEPATDSADIVIGKAAASAVATGGSFTYDGQPHGGACRVTGIGSDVLAGVTTYSTGTAPVNAGSHTITCSFAGDGNYDPASDTAEIVIGKATPVIHLTAPSTTYTAAPYAGATCSAEGVAGASLPAALGFEDAAHASLGGAPIDAG